MQLVVGPAFSQLTSQYATVEGWRCLCLLPALPVMMMSDLPMHDDTVSMPV